MQTSSKKLSFGLVLAGLLFFFNPSFAALDLLPDFLGCLLIYAGLYRVSKIYAPLAETAARFLRLAAVDVVKDILLIAVFSGQGSAEMPTAILSVAFAFVAVEMLFYIPAMLSLFNGIIDLAMRLNCTALYESKESVFARFCRLFRRSDKKGGASSRAERLCRFTIAFLILRDLFCLLPELSALTLSASDSALSRIYDHIGVMRGFSFIIVLILGVAWLVCLIAFFVSLKKQHAFRKELGERYARFIKANPGAIIRLQHFVAFVLLGLGTLLCADFYLDFKNILPDVLAAALLLSGALLLRLPIKKKVPLAALAAVYGAVAFVSSKLSYDFSTNYRASGISKVEEVTRAYQRMWAVSLIEFLAFLAFVAVLLLSLRYTVSEYAGYRPTHADASFENRNLQVLRAEFDGEFIKTAVFAIFAGLASFLFDYLKQIPSKGFFRILEFFWSLDLLVGILFAVVMISTLVQLYGQICKKYAFEGIE